MDTTVIILIVVVAVLVIALAAVGVMLSRRKRSERLQEHFGPEYERSLSETGDRKATEAELTEREQRHRKLDIRDLRPEERSPFEESWNGIQRGFVDDPVRALRDADTLVVEIMRVRGYPVDDFERRAEDISVEHPDVVHHYREARKIHDASHNSTEDTERQRHAVTSYRSLVEALLGHEPRAGHIDPDSHRGTRTDQVGSTDTPNTEERTR